MADWIIMLNDKIIKQFPLEDGEKVSIGRGKEADITIDNTAISRKHISIESTAGIYLVSDLGSTNGSFVNNQKVSENVPVSDADQIEFGKFRLLAASNVDIDATIADSISANIMDLDEETVFVTSSHATTPQTQENPAFGENTAKLTVLNGNATPRDISLADKNSIKIGKAPKCDIVIPGFFVAKAQFYVFKRNSNYIIVPQKSWVGTFVNNSKISEELTLRNRDIIKVRNTSIRFTG